MSFQCSWFTFNSSSTTETKGGPKLGLWFKQMDVVFEVSPLIVPIYQRLEHLCGFGSCQTDYSQKKHNQKLQSMQVPRKLSQGSAC